MAHDYRPEQSTAWATIAIILLVIVAILLIGYFAWWAPQQRDVVVMPDQLEPQVEPAPEPEPREPAELTLQEDLDTMRGF